MGGYQRKRINLPKRGETLFFGGETDVIIDTLEISQSLQTRFDRANNVPVQTHWIG